MRGISPGFFKGIPIRTFFLIGALCFMPHSAFSDTVEVRSCYVGMFDSGLLLDQVVRICVREFNGARSIIVEERVSGSRFGQPLCGRDATSYRAKPRFRRGARPHYVAEIPSRRDRCAEGLRSSKVILRLPGSRTPGSFIRREHLKGGLTVTSRAQLEGDFFIRLPPMPQPR